MSLWKDLNPNFDNLNKKLKDIESAKKNLEETQKRASKKRHLSPRLSPQIRRVPDINLAGKLIPVTELLHVLLLGATRSGKTKIIEILLKSLFESDGQLLRNNILPMGHNYIIFDAKNDYLDWIPDIGLINDFDVNIIKFGDPNSCCIDVASLVNDNPVWMMNLAKILLPTSKGERFWSLVGQGIIYVTILALRRKYGTNWGLHTLYDTSITSLETFYRFIGTTRDGKAFVSRYFDTEGGDNVKFGILAELGATLMDFLPAVELQRKTPKRKWLKIEDMIEEGRTITLICNSPGTEQAIRPLFNLINTYLNYKIISLPDGIKKRIFLLIDEVPFWEKLKEMPNFLQFSTAKGLRVILGVQDFNSLVQIYSPPLAKAFAGNAASHVYLRPASRESADYCVAQMGTRRVRQQSISHSSSGYSINENLVVRSPIESGDLFDLPLANLRDGIQGYLNAPSNLGGIRRFSIPSKTVTKLLPDKPRLSRVANIIRDNSSIYSNENHKRTASRKLLLQGLNELQQSFNSTHHYQDFLSVCSEEIDLAIAKQVWKTMKASVNKMIHRLEER